MGFRSNAPPNVTVLGGAFIGAKLYRNVDYSPVPSGILTAVPFDGESADTHGFHTAGSSRITIPTGLAGWYDLAGTIRYSPSYAGERQARLHQNGTGAIYGGVVAWDAAGGESFRHVSAIAYCAVGDFLELVAYHSSAAGDMNLLNGHTAFSCTYLGT